MVCCGSDTADVAAVVSFPSSDLVAEDSSSSTTGFDAAGDAVDIWVGADGSVVDIAATAADFADGDLSAGDSVGEMFADEDFAGGGFVDDVFAIAVSAAAAEATGAVMGDEGGVAEALVVLNESVFGAAASDRFAPVWLVFDSPDSFRVSDGIAGNAAVVVATAEVAGARESGKALACDGGVPSGEGDVAACGEPRAASFGGDAFGGSFCASFRRLMEPVTESSPCSRAVMRANNRSRSPFNVSMAEARRLASFSLVLAIDWNCWDCLARSAAAICSCRSPVPDW